jgi:pimeloyl-ACP methyl ester carboxylesterase
MRSWRYYRNLLVYYASLLLMALAAVRALRQPVYWLATFLLWALHLVVRRAFAYAHPSRGLSLVQESLGDFKEIRYQSHDGLTLAARFAAGWNQGTIILAHDLAASGQDLARLARLLRGAGFGILLLDLRAHGRSQGDTSTYGWKEGEDLACAVEYLLTRVDVNGGKIGAYGLSLGAQAVLRGALKSDQIQALVLENLGPSGLADHGGRPGSVMRWVNLPSDWLFYSLYRWMIGGGQPGVLELIGDIAPRPIFFIASEDHERYFTRLFHASAGDPKELWEVSNTLDRGAMAKDPNQYMQRLIAFFNKNLDIKAGTGWQPKTSITSTN